MRSDQIFPLTLLQVFLAWKFPLKIAGFLRVEDSFSPIKDFELQFKVCCTQILQKQISHFINLSVLLTIKLTNAYFPTWTCCSSQVRSEYQPAPPPFHPSLMMNFGMIHYFCLFIYDYSNRELKKTYRHFIYLCSNNFKLICCFAKSDLLQLIFLQFHLFRLCF